MTNLDALHFSDIEGIKGYCQDIRGTKAVVDRMLHNL